MAILKASKKFPGTVDGWLKAWRVERFVQMTLTVLKEIFHDVTTARALKLQATATKLGGKLAPAKASKPCPGPSSDG